MMPPPTHTPIHSFPPVPLPISPVYAYIYNLLGVILQHPPSSMFFTDSLSCIKVCSLIPSFEEFPFQSLHLTSSNKANCFSLFFLLFCGRSSLSPFLIAAAASSCFLFKKKKKPFLSSLNFFFFFYTFYLFFITPIFSTLLSKSPRCLTGKMRKLNPLGEVGGGCFNLFGNYQFPLLLLLFLRL